MKNNEVFIDNLTRESTVSAPGRGFLGTSSYQGRGVLEEFGLVTRKIIKDIGLKNNVYSVFLL